jgi:hypothetical protein
LAIVTLMLLGTSTLLLVNNIGPSQA